MMKRRLAAVLPLIAMMAVAACADDRIQPLDLTSPMPAATPTEALRNTVPATCAPDAPNTHSPVGATPTVVTVEDTPVKFQFLAADDDLPCDSFMFRLEFVPTGGWLYQVAPDGTVGTQFLRAGDVVANPDGWLMFVPNPNLNGNPVGVLTYHITDAAGHTSIRSYLEIKVTPVNDAPTADDGTSTAFNTIEVADVTARAHDVDLVGNVDICVLDLPRDGTLYWTVALPGNEVRKGECKTSDGSFKYVPKWTTLACQLVPASFFPKRDSFTWKAFDGDLYSRVATQTIEFLHENTIPVFSGQQTKTILEEQSADFRLEAFDPEGDAVDFRIVGLPSNGTLKIMGFPITSVPYNVPLVAGPTPTITYTPNKDFVTQPGMRDRFLVRVRAGGVTRNCNYEVGALVNPVNDAPVVSGPANLSATRTGGGQVVPAQTNDIKIADDARASDQLSITLRAQGAAAGGVAFVDPTGITWQRISATEINATGTLSAINAALGRGVTWMPNAGTDEIGELFVSVNDNGSYGATSTGALVGTKTIVVNVAEDVPLLMVGRP